MFINYLKIALRNLLRHKGFSFINIVGLAIGLAGCLLITLFVLDEFSYDRHHAKADRIYRVDFDAMLGGGEIRSTASPKPMAPTFVAEFPEVERAVRLQSEDEVFRLGNLEYNENNIIYADSNIFDIFTIPVLAGDSQTALNKPYSIVLTQSSSHKYFGEENPVGRDLVTSDGRNYQVTAVVADVPRNSHFHFDFLVAANTDPNFVNDVWVSLDGRTYILLREGANPDALAAKFPDLIRKYVGQQIQAATGLTFDAYLASGSTWDFILQPLTGIHLYSHRSDEWEENGDILYVYIFSITALFILVIACINFMNLTTARSAGRAREVGLRKVVGSSRRQLIGQFLGESILLSLLGLFLALAIVQAILPYFNQLAGRELSLGATNGIRFGLIILGVVVLMGMAAGSYPAFYLSAFQPMDVLHGKVQAGIKSGGMRTGLVIFQFAVSIALIIGTLMVMRQISYVQNRHMGFYQDQIIVIPDADVLDPQGAAFKAGLLEYPGIISAAFASTLPGYPASSISGHLRDGASREEIRSLATWGGDYDFLATMGMELAQGRDFSRDFPNDS
ncbi:MAG: ABC transporter permease, partial [Candidatus Neomarinimicrobiota bacterium]